MTKKIPRRVKVLGWSIMNERRRILRKGWEETNVDGTRKRMKFWWEEFGTCMQSQVLPHSAILLLSVLFLFFSSMNICSFHYFRGKDTSCLLVNSLHVLIMKSVHRIPPSISLYKNLFDSTSPYLFIRLTRKVSYEIHKSSRVRWVLFGNAERSSLNWSHCLFANVKSSFQYCNLNI